MLLTKDKKPRSMRAYKVVAAELLALQAVWAEALAAGLPDRAGEEHALRAADHLVALLGPVQAEYLALCRQANRYDFLTVALGRRSCRSSPAVRQTLHQRYRYVMIDEFQDTNPLQWEIIAFIVGEGPEGLLDRDRICIVGDPQQSIFRFRQADVRVFQQAQERIMATNRRHGLRWICSSAGQLACTMQPPARAQRNVRRTRDLGRELSFAQPLAAVAHGSGFPLHLRSRCAQARSWISR